MVDNRQGSPTWDSYCDAARLFVRGATVASALPISLAVGTWLSLVNHGSAVFDGRPPWLKIALDYLTPFVVASLGFLAARRRRNLQDPAGLLTQRRTGDGRPTSPGTGDPDEAAMPEKE